jgi:hypothetical protein
MIVMRLKKWRRTGFEMGCSGGAGREKASAAPGGLNQCDSTAHISSLALLPSTSKYFLL